MLLTPNIFLSQDLGNASTPTSDIQSEWFSDKFQNAILFARLDQAGAKGDWFKHKRWAIVANNHKRSNRLLEREQWDQLTPDHQDAALYETTRPKIRAADIIALKDLTNSKTWHSATNSLQVARNVTAYSDILTRVTRHAEVIEIVDPYLDFSSGKGGYNWLLDTLNQCKTGVIRRITFHVDVNTQRLTETTANVASWFSRTFDVASAACVIQVWLKLHDRYLITNRHVLSIGHGFGLAGGKSTSSYTHWALLNKRDSESQRNQMDCRISRESHWPSHVRTILVCGNTP